MKRLPAMGLWALLLSACASATGDPADTSFTAVTGISGVPDTAYIDVRVSLSEAKVEPEDATNRSIIWSWKDVDQTEFTRIATGQFMTESRTGETLEGSEITLRAQVENGLAKGVPFSQDFTIPVRLFTPVANITGAPKTGAADTAIDLSGVTVEPEGASFTAILWTVKSGAGALNGALLTPAAAGDLVVTATIAKGALDDGALAPYTQDFSIAINAALEGDTFNFDPERSLDLGPAAMSLSKTTSPTATFSVRTKLSGYEWHVDGVRQASTSRTLTINAADYALGSHSITAGALVDGVRYSQSIGFIVGP
jgi:hypothetical protein